MSKEKISQTDVQTVVHQESELTVSCKKLAMLSETINVLLTVQRRSDYAIAYVLNLIKKHHKDDVKELGFENVEKYAEYHFGFSKSTYHAYTKVSERFITPVVETRKCLTTNVEITDLANIVAETSFEVLTDVDGYEFSISQMLELLPLTESELKEHLEEFSSGDTTKAIREKVKSIRSAIETTATDTDTATDSTDTTTDNTDTATDSTDTATDTSEPMTDNKRLLTILAIANDIENENFKNTLIELLNQFINA